MTPLSVSNRILAGFAAITAILIILGLYALAQIGAVRTTIDNIVQRDMATIATLDRIEAATTRMIELRTGAVRGFALGTGGDSEAVAAWSAQVDTVQTGLATLGRSVDDYAARSTSAARGERWRRMSDEVRTAEQALAQTRTAAQAQFAAIAAGDRAAVIAREPLIQQSRTQLIERLGLIKATLDDTIVAGRSAASDVYTRSRISILAGLLVGALVSLAIAFAIRRSITAPLGAFMEFVDRIGAGDLSGQTAEVRSDELGRLGGTINRMVAGLRDLAVQSREATENLNAAATEIRASTQQQAASVEQQLAAVQETAATVDEITHSGSQITRRAQEVIVAAQATAATSDAGIAAVDDTVRAMDGIREQAEAVAGNVIALSEKTQAIGEIIATVNDVSERAHLLALNASIEAAAAGEAGRSFAIVASELKTLADQAKDSTRQVRGLLGEIQRGINASVMLTEEAVKRAESGKSSTDAAQDAIDQMSARIQESVQTFQQIVASTNQQQIGIEQVTIALQNIRQASQQTAASTRQLDQAAGDLTGLSRTLLGLAERYRL